MWRMPVFKHYTKNMTDCVLADLNNIGTGGRMAGSCTAAAFLKVCLCLPPNITPHSIVILSITHALILFH